MAEKHVGWRQALLAVVLALLAVAAFLTYLRLQVADGLGDVSPANLLTVIVAGSLIGVVLGAVLLVVGNVILAMYLSARGARRGRHR
jgi:hypothetical protein